MVKVTLWVPERSQKLHKKASIQSHKSMGAIYAEMVDKYLRDPVLRLREENKEFQRTIAANLIKIDKIETQRNDQHLKEVGYEFDQPLEKRIEVKAEHGSN